jgi:hypothetical protein
MPKHYPGYKFNGESVQLGDSNEDISVNRMKLQEWSKCTRVAVREKVFIMSPHVAAEYYAKRAIHVKEQEEQRLREMITAAIPTGAHGWEDDFPQPRINIKHSDEAPTTPDLKLTAV